MKRRIFAVFATVFLTVVTAFFPSCSTKKEEGKTMELNALFSDGMVFQAEKPVRIFGTGDGSVSVSLRGETVSGESKDGKWLVELSPVPYGGPYEMTLSLNGTDKKLSNVCFGDVLLLAGQSNIQFKMKSESSDKLKWTMNENIRYFALDSLDVYEYFKPTDGWVSCKDRTTVSNVSAIGYHVAEQINGKTGHYVGLIGCYQGASVIESWLPEEIAQKPEYTKYSLDLLHKDHTAYAYKAWNEKAGTLYHYMFETILPFSVGNVLFYQGESNTTELEAEYYADMVKDLIDRWRVDLKDETLPFVLVQIADYDARKDDGWRLIQEAQARVPSMTAGVKLVVSKDVCASDNIHPSDKRELSLRIANTILGN